MNAKEAYEYALNVLQAPFPEGEAAIATDAAYSYCYARYVLKAPFKLGEKVIAESSDDSYLYAKEVLNAPFPLGEKVIVKDLNSTNGTYINGERITELEVEEQITFRVGVTEIRIASEIQ